MFFLNSLLQQKKTRVIEREFTSIYSSVSSFPGHLHVHRTYTASGEVLDQLAIIGLMKQFGERGKGGAMAKLKRKSETIAFAICR